MATIYNSDLTREVRDGAKIQQSRESIPSQLADKIVPVMEVNPKLLRRARSLASLARSTTGTGTVMTASSNKTTILTGLTAGFIKTATCDVATGDINVYTTIGGASVALLRLPVLTLTAQEQNVSIQFSTPIEIDLGATIVFSGTFTAGSLVRTAVVYGYEVDNPNS